MSRVLDIHHNEKDILLCDTSATAHMPDVIEMPYQPSLLGAKKNPQGNYTKPYIVGGNSCLSGDTMGTYYFRDTVTVGDTLIFEDMAQYTMVKNTQFNGIMRPGIVHLRKDGHLWNRHLYNQLF